MEEFIPKEVTRFFITHKADGISEISKNYIFYYLGKYNVFVSDIKKLSGGSFLVTVKYTSDKDIEHLYQQDTHPLKIRRIFKTSFYDSEKFDKQVMGLFAETAANLLGLLKGKKAVVKIQMTPHRNLELKNKFLELAMKYRDEKKFDTMFDPKGANIFLKIRKVQNVDKIGLIIWIEDPNRIIGE